jgi:predicted phosphodiesterase
MNKYLLTIVGNIDSKQCPDIVMSLGDVVDSKHVKFIHNPNAFIFCFGSV